MNKIKFGTDGWRGIIAEDFTFENVRNVVQAIARYVVRAEKPGAGLLVGYDTRFGSERFARAAAETVSAAGIPVWLAADAAPTPALSLLVKHPRRRRRHSNHRQPQSLSMEWHEIQSQLRQLRLARHRRPNRSRAAKVLRDKRPALPPQPNLIHSLDVRAPYLDTLDKLVDWDTPARREFPLRH